MVLAKRICPPERRKAIIAVAAKPSSPTLSVRSNSADGHQPEPFQLRISLRIAETTRPGQAITICTDGTVFAPSPAPNDALDTLARGTVSLTSAADPARRINLGRFLAHRARPDSPPPADLKQRPATRLLTIPAGGAQVEVAHGLPPARVFRHEGQLQAADIVGETWRLQLSGGFVGATWWCWGALDGELQEKRLSAWHEGMRPEFMPKPEVGDEWVLGCDPVELVFEDRTEDSTFQFVE